MRVRATTPHTASPRDVPSCQMRSRSLRTKTKSRRRAQAHQTCRATTHRDDEPYETIGRPGDATDGDERHLSGPTELPDMLEGMMEQVREQRVEKKMLRQWGRGMSIREVRRTVRQDEYISTIPGTNLFRTHVPRPLTSYYLNPFQLV